MDLPKVVVVSGEFGSGKTLFCLTTGFPMERTLVFDLEGSSAQYEAMSFHRVDLPARVAENVVAWKPVDLWKAFAEEAERIQPGMYDVIAIDPISELEMGLGDYVLQNPKLFGRTADQYLKSSGIYWGDVKALEKRVLTTLSAKCNLLIITAHMRDQWRGNTPTGRRERRGKETLTELAALELLLERDPNKVLPAGVVVKSRLVWINPKDPTDIRPALPPRIPECTWAKVKAYLSSPPDWGSLSEEEKYREKPLLTEEEKLIMQAEIAASQVAYACSDCGAQIRPVKVGTKEWSVGEIVEACTVKGWPPLCWECATKRKKEGA